MRTNLETTITTALRVAAVEYGKDAALARTSGHASVRLADQFDQQARQAIELADDIDERGLTAGIERWQRR